MEEFNFTKIEAAGNDFICVDGGRVSLDIFSVREIKKLCDRRLGIGADGLVYLSQDKDKNLAMAYFNADGSRGKLCGNGLRAAVLFAFKLGLLEAGVEQIIRADDGPHQALLQSPEEIQVEMFHWPAEAEIPLDGLELPAGSRALGFINTWVPHLVLEIYAEISDGDVLDWGNKLRNDPVFQPQGTNVNFLRRSSGNKLFVRTYERGVENETLSCGSGVTASSLLYWQNYGINNGNLDVQTQGGCLSVFRKDGKLFLKGPARMVYEGKFLNN
jgi:diaminopimelate epimerase